MTDEKLPSYKDLYPQTKKCIIWKERIRNFLKRPRNFLDSIEEDRRAREWQEAILDAKAKCIADWWTDQLDQEIEEEREEQPSTFVK
ncbi:hypothetical protein GX50_02741 [[Emmonsia] crescens]|uniref:Uncharacterized protein n=1 Tax=[Emmonsia] crescens TaxID=73230 RepID=A0A2B7ZD46_9EURO|nr:hypothetical protein GX50_02741 [Emmonsia crescens]